MVATPSSYRPDIDGLRAIAILAVVINHSNAMLLPSGYLGVDLFFVISGYVISASLSRRDQESIGPFLLDFYARRVKRLLPALVCCVLITGVAISFFNPDPTYSLKTGLTSLFGISNIYLLKTAANYFGESAALNAFTHTWSLGVEEQFYAVYPVLFWVFIDRQFRFRTVIALISAASLAAFFALSESWKDFAFYMMPTRFWEFGVGVLTFSLNQMIDRSRFDGIISNISLLAISTTFFAPEHLERYSTIAIVIFASITIAKIQSESHSYRVLTTPTSLFFGRISYSLYLWHWSVLSIARWTVGISLLSYPFLMVLMFLLGWASYQFIEKPFRYRKWSGTSARTVALAVFVTCVSAVFMLLLVKPLRGKLFLGKMPALEAQGVFTLTDSYTLPDGTSWKGADCVLSDNQQVGKRIAVDGCTLGNPKAAQQRILVIGNSYSTAMVHAFDELALRGDYAVTVTSSWGASVVPEIKNNSYWDKANDFYWSDIVPEHMKNLRRGDWVLMINDMAQFSPEKQSSATLRELNLLESGLTNLADKLHDKGVNLAIMHGNPFARDAKCDPTQAISQWYSFSARCKFLSREATISRRMPLNRVLERVRSKMGVKVIDLLPIFCPTEICSYEDANGVVLYRDEYSHPSIEAARLSSGTIRSSLKEKEVDHNAR